MCVDKLKGSSVVKWLRFLALSKAQYDDISFYTCAVSCHCRNVRTKLDSYPSYAETSQTKFSWANDTPRSRFLWSSKTSNVVQSEVSEYKTDSQRVRIPHHQVQKPQEHSGVECRQIVPLLSSKHRIHTSSREELHLTGSSSYAMGSN